MPSNSDKCGVYKCFILKLQCENNIKIVPDPSHHLYVLLASVRASESEDFAITSSPISQQSQNHIVHCGAVLCVSPKTAKKKNCNNVALNFFRQKSLAACWDEELVQ